MSAISLCSLVVVGLSIIAIVCAFVYLFKVKQPAENDLNVIQRQIRGFALLILSQVIFIVGSLVCAGNLGSTFRQLIASRNY